MVGVIAWGVMDESPKPISVFLLDDHEIVRRGVRELIEAEPGLTVVGEASTAAVTPGEGA